ncbi:hypothetical protein [Brachybacterium sacelli]|uniref:Uncharacterized protein n=1 Tax=Brachybacterium sacelli TaxID=173364 RepID=A0ABS4WYL8_9MICO|nr:hypothetical protein [Brachybacterium sacelli]MBP2380604.1 hypothetical protein [Brachybacterium sacelli]
MLSNSISTTLSDHGTGRANGGRAGAPRWRTGRRAAAPLAGLACTAALLAGGAGSGDVAQAAAAGTTRSQVGADAASEVTARTGSDENLFEGTWTFGHTTKTLTAEELAAVTEEEAEARGPEEMSLTVQCADGIDTSIRDYEAVCVAIADEGVEHPWMLTGGPADAGLVVEVDNLE